MLVNFQFDTRLHIHIQWVHWVAQTVMEAKQGGIGYPQTFTLPPPPQKAVSQQYAGTVPCHFKRAFNYGPYCYILTVEDGELSR